MLSAIFWKVEFESGHLSKNIWIVMVFFSNVLYIFGGKNGKTQSSGMAVRKNT